VKTLPARASDEEIAGLRATAASRGITLNALIRERLGLAAPKRGGIKGNRGNPHGRGRSFTLTTVEPEGEYAGEEMGRIWLLHGGRSDWAGLGSVDAARRAAEDLRDRPLADVRAWFDAQ
jgi:hypothetical protein